VKPGQQAYTASARRRLPAVTKPKGDPTQLQAKFGQQAQGTAFSCRRARQGRTGQRKEMIKPDRDLSLKRQAQLLGISRGTVYDLPRPTSDADQRLMRRIDALHLECPFHGSRMLRVSVNPRINADGMGSVVVNLALRAGANLFAAFRSVAHPR
jgi:hypothetical protein